MSPGRAALDSPPSFDLLGPQYLGFQRVLLLLLHFHFLDGIPDLIVAKRSPEFFLQEKVATSNPSLPLASGVSPRHTSVFRAAGIFDGLVSSKIFLSFQRFVVLPGELDCSAKSARRRRIFLELAQAAQCH